MNVKIKTAPKEGKKTDKARKHKKKTANERSKIKKTDVQKGT